MSKANTYQVFVPFGDPARTKLITQLNWTGICIAFPRADWSLLRERPEFGSSGIYVLIGPQENSDDDLPMVYIGQGEQVGKRIDSHSSNKDFWDWCYVFVASENSLNKAHITWLEFSLIMRAFRMKRSIIQNGQHPKEPSLAEHVEAEMHWFLGEMLQVLPLVGVDVFKKSIAVATPNSKDAVIRASQSSGEIDTIVVPAREEGFNSVFLGENSWWAIRIGGGKLDKIKFIASYQTSPISAITHYAPVKQIEPYGDKGKYKLVFSEPATELENPIVIGNASPATMQASRYTSLTNLLKAKTLSDVF
jgi:hypothetical protein